jgi:hypothetical protein
LSDFHILAQDFSNYTPASVPDHGFSHSSNLDVNSTVSPGIAQSSQALDEGLFPAYASWNAATEVQDPSFVMNQALEAIFQAPAQSNRK